MKTLQQFLQEQTLSNRTIAEYINSYNKFTKWLEAENINIIQASYVDLTVYVRHLRKRGISNAVIINNISSLKYVFKWLIAEKQRTTNPALAIHIKKKSLQKVLTCLPEDKLDNIYTQFLSFKPYNRAKDIQAHSLYTVTIGFIIYQGLNNNSLQRLLTTDINLDEGNVYIAGNNTSNARLLPLNAKQIVPIIQYLQRVKTERFYNQGVADLLRFLQVRIYKVTGEPITIRQLIDSRILLWLKQHNIRQVQYYCGFKYLSSLKKYQQQEIDSLMLAVERFHPMG